MPFLIFQSLGPAELIILFFFFVIAVAPIIVGINVLSSRRRLKPWKVVVLFLTGWIGAVAFILFDR